MLQTEEEQERAQTYEECNSQGVKITSKAEKEDGTETIHNEVAKERTGFAYSVGKIAG